MVKLLAGSQVTGVRFPSGPQHLEHIHGVLVNLEPINMDIQTRMLIQLLIRLNF
jgi:hypothetical protein